MGCCEFVGIEKNRFFFTHSRKESENNLNTYSQSVSSLRQSTQYQTHISLKSGQILTRNISQHFSEYSQDNDLNLPDVSSASSIISWKKINKPN